MDPGKALQTSLSSPWPFCLWSRSRPGTRRVKADRLCLHSRVALKKYIQANNKGVGSGPTFDSQFNRAVKAGVEQGIFAQPKGVSQNSPPSLSNTDEVPSSATFCFVFPAGVLYAANLSSKRCLPPSGPAAVVSSPISSTIYSSCHSSIIIRHIWTYQASKERRCQIREEACRQKGEASGEESCCHYHQEGHDGRQTQGRQSYHDKESHQSQASQRQEASQAEIQHWCQTYDQERCPCCHGREEGPRQNEIWTCHQDQSHRRQTRKEGRGRHQEDTGEEGRHTQEEERNSCRRTGRLINAVLPSLCVCSSILDFGPSFHLLSLSL